MLREQLVSRELNPLLNSLPAKFEQIHNYQVDAIDEIISHYQAGYRMVVLEAPTGSGKSLIAECVRRLLKTRATYVCHNKELQAQFDREFDYAKVLYGRANYKPTDYHSEFVSCEDCDWSEEKETCSLCRYRDKCPYVVAKNRAIHSPIPILNSAYWLNEVMGKRSRFANTGLCILDEATPLSKY